MTPISEDHSREQYFFDAPTAEALADLVAGFDKVCCLAAPTVARVLIDRGRSPTLLDIDERLAELPGFQRFDILRPEGLDGAGFEAIICDPPFFKVPLRALKRAIMRLAGYRLDIPLFIAWLARRPAPLLRAFEPFGLEATDVALGYETVAQTPKNAILLYTNT